MLFAKGLVVPCADVQSLAVKGCSEAVEAVVFGYWLPIEFSGAHLFALVIRIVVKLFKVRIATLNRFVFLCGDYVSQTRFFFISMGIF